MNSFFVFSSELIVIRILIVNIVVNNFFSFLKKYIIIIIIINIIIIKLCFCSFAVVWLFADAQVFFFWLFTCLVFFSFFDLSVGPKHGILFQKKSCSSSDGILCTCSSPVLPEPVKVKKLTGKHRILNNSICNRFNLRHPHNASGVKGSLFLLHTVYCTCTHLAC